MNQVGELLEKYQNIVLQGFDPVSAGGFTQVPNLLLKSSLSANAKVVYAQLLSYAWTNDRCYPGQERMADDLGSTKSTVNRAIIELQETGWLEVERRGQGKTNIYTLKYVVNSARVVDKKVNK
jgi:predicted transcriptional regulator